MHIVILAVSEIAETSPLPLAGESDRWPALKAVIAGAFSTRLPPTRPASPVLSAPNSQCPTAPASTDGPFAAGVALAVALTALEFLVAFLQAYVFAILTCVYLNDALHPGH